MDITETSVSVETSSYKLGMRLYDWLHDLHMWVFDALHVPGFVRALDEPDLVTGDRFRIRISKYYTIISVNNRDYYFDRRNGEFGGTGMSCCSPACSQEEQLRRIIGT